MLFARALRRATPRNTTRALGGHSHTHEHLTSPGDYAKRETGPARRGAASTRVEAER